MKLIGHDEHYGPIWELTREEYQQRCQESAASRARAGQEQAKSAPQTSEEPVTEPALPAEDSHSKETAPQSPKATELGSRIWQMRKKGLSRYEVHRRLGIPIAAVDEILEEFQRRFYPWHWRSENPVNSSL